MSKTPMADEYPPCDYCEHRDKPPVAEPCIDCERESAGKWSKYVPIFKVPAWGDVLHYLSTHRLWGLARVVNDGMARIRELERALTAERERADRNQEDAERWNLLCELWHASTELSLMQEEDGRWSIKQVEDIDGEMFYQLWGDTPDAAIDAARRK